MLKDIKEFRVLKDIRDIKEFRVLLVQMVVLVLKVIKEFKVHQQQELMERFFKYSHIMFVEKVLIMVYIVHGSILDLVLILRQVLPVIKFL